jgi:hypothetical protein
MDTENYFIVIILESPIWNLHAWYFENAYMKYIQFKRYI